MLNVFISYRRAESSTLSQLLEVKLAKYGIRAYVDTRKVDSAGPFPERLRKAIAESDVVVVLLGPSTLESAWVLEEIRYAHALGKSMIPVFQERYTPPQGVDDPAVNALLQSDGVRILEISNIYVDEAINQIAAMIPRKRQLRERLWKALLALLFVSGGAASVYLYSSGNGSEAKQPFLSDAGMASNPNRRVLRRPVKFAAVTLIAGVVVAFASLIIRQSGIQNIVTLITNTPPVIANADTIAQQFRDDFNAIVAEFGRGDCIGFTADEEFVYGADWVFSFTDEGLLDDIPIGHDSAISPDGTMAAVSNDALYRLGEDTERMFGIGGLPKFSADNRYLASDRIGIKEIETARLVRDGGGVEVYTAISPDGRYAVLRQTREENAAVIDVQAGQTIIEDEDGNGFEEAQFSPSGRLLAIAGVGVYEIPSGRLIIESDATGTTFSPDGRIIAGGRAIADTSTGEIVLQFDSAVPAFFTPDSRYLALQGVGVYDLSTMTRLFDLGDTGVAVSSDGQTVASQLTGWFRVQDGEFFPIDDAADDNYYYSPPLFMADDRLVAFDGDGIYSIDSGRKLLNYPHDFVAFAPGRGLILVELEEEGCAMIGDSGAYSNSEPIPVE